MCRRVSASIVAIVLSLGYVASAGAQSRPGAAAPTTLTLPSNSIFAAPSTTTLSARRTSMFEAAQIVDRPTADLRPRFHWGVIGSFIPHWSIPGSMGNLFFESANSPQMSGRDFRVGVVRARQLGFEMGGSFVRKTVSSVHVQYADPTIAGQVSSVTYTAPNAVHMTGVDAYIVIPFARIGERVQLGVLAGGGMAWLPDTPLQKVVEGPPFYANANSFTPLSSPPAAGGFVRDDNFTALPLAPGARSVTTTGTLYDISPTDHFWMLLRGQLAADFLVAPPLKLRVAGGFHYPGTQALGIDVVYLFRTGRVGTTQTDPAAPATPVTQVADRPQVLAPRRSYWGVLAGAGPQWWTPDSWGPIFEPDDPTTVKGREFRIGLTRGRPLGYEFGVSFVMKSFTEFEFERPGGLFPANTTTSGIPAEFFNIAQPSRITLLSIEPVQAPGAEFHAFVPIGRVGSRLQVGSLLGAGIARMPDTAIRKRIEGPSFFATATNPAPLATLPASGGFVVDEDGQPFPVPPGQTGTDLTVSATEISPLGKTLLLLRAQIAADVLLAAPFKVRFSGGFNYPGAQLLNIEVVYLFGTGR